MDVDTILLVHGAWHGGWCWDRVLPTLSAKGFKVVAPTLPGLEPTGGHGQPPSLEDHVQCVVEEIDRAEGKVLLVGHSYGGMVITGAADRTRERIAGLVYLDAAVPSDGASFASHIPGIELDTVARRKAAFTAMAGGGDWIKVPSFDVLGIADEGDRAWVGPRLKPHPLRTWLEPLTLSKAGTRGIHKTYVLSISPPTVLMGYPLHGQAAKTAPEWSYREVATGHELMVLEPERTAELILEAAER
jgi:pimeloyl-ACP methyl ester carboxylesterase